MKTFVTARAASKSCIGDSEQMTCVYNPVTGRERTWGALKPAQQKKRVVIVGAGPAGMEAALAAHARGHEVTAFEKSGQVGGQVHLAAASPMRRMFVRIAEFYQRQAQKGEFEIRLSTQATPASIASIGPDAVSRRYRLQTALRPGARRSRDMDGARCPQPRS